MDWLTESPAYYALGPQLMGVKVLEICAGVLLLLALLTFIIGWAQHRSRRIWLLALVPLAVGIAAGITAHVLHDNVCPLGVFSPPFRRKYSSCSCRAYRQ
jgi:hypothetical protein